MEEIKLAGFVVSAGASYVAFIYKLCQVRRGRHDVVYRALLATLGFECLTFTMGVVAVASPTLLGVHNLPILAVHLSAVAFCVSALIVLLLWAMPLPEARTRIRNWLVAGGVLGAALITLFFAGDAPGRPASALDVGSKNPVILAYLLLFIVSQAIPCVVIWRQCLPYMRSAANPWLRRALRLLAISAVVLLAYCAARTIDILSPLLGIKAGNVEIASSIFSAIGIVILSASMTMPSWGAQLSRLHQWTRDYSSYRALYPLWSSLYESAPDIALEPPTAAITDINYRLHRRVIEIRDAWRTLRPYMADPDAAGDLAANGNSADQTDQAAIEAMKIRYAIRAKQAGRPAPADPQANGSGYYNAETLSAEIFWLTRVSDAYARLD